MTRGVMKTRIADGSKNLRGKAREKIDERRVSTVAYPYNRPGGDCESNHIVGATPCGCPAIERQRSI
jgi:hypothetical protein